MPIYCLRTIDTQKELKELTEFKIFLGKLIVEKHRSCMILVSQYSFYEIKLL